MKQYKHSEVTNNFTESVREDFSQISWEMVKPLLKHKWQTYIDLMEWDIDHIVELYQSLGYRIQDICDFDYEPNAQQEYYQTNQAFLLVKPNVAKSYNEHVSKKVGYNVYTWYDQYVTLTNYHGVSSKEVLKALILESFPFFKESVFYKPVEVKKDFSYLEYFTLEELAEMDAFKAMTAAQFKRMFDSQIIELIPDNKMVQNKPLFSVYFNESNETCNLSLFVETNNIAVIVPLEALKNRNIDFIESNDYTSQKMFLDKLSPMERGERISNPPMERIKEYCTNGH